jgi:serine protease AprX
MTFKFGDYLKIILRPLSFIILLSASHSVSAQSFQPDSIAYRYWIYFKDKGIFKPDSKLVEGSDGYLAALSELSERALWRRAKVLPLDEVVRFEDIPVDKSYIAQVKGIAPIHAVSKWFNAVSVRAKRSELDRIKELPFVLKIEGVHFLEFAHVIRREGSQTPLYRDSVVNLRYDYGPSFWQNQQINTPILHYIGVTGWGVRVGMCDDGFNWRKQESLRTRKVLAEYDWIFKDDSTHYQFPPNQFPGDDWDQDNHGTATMSTLGGFFNGKLIGPAFDVEFFLSKSEDNLTETPVEEDYWLEAVEWMEANGVDVITSSLIYKPFDDPNDDYTYADMDGKTTVIVRAATHAAHLGVVVCNSMGNEWQKYPPSIVSPPDGDSVIAVGAVDSAGQITYFSSNGPTSDGRIKPDVVAMGQDVYTAMSWTFTWDDSSYTWSSGTSFSCPLTAGVCALILSAHPELTPMQVRDALRNTASKKDNPDNTYGWGLINAYEAALYHGMIMSNKPEIKFEADKITVSVYTVSKTEISGASVKLFYTLDGSNDFREAEMTLVERLGETNSGKYSVEINRDESFGMLKLFITAQDETSTVSIPYNAPEKFFYLEDEGSEINLSF